MDYYHDCSDCRYEFDCNADIECDGDCEACEYSFQCAYCYYCTRRLETQSDVWYNVTREELHKNIAYCVKEKFYAIDRGDKPNYETNIWRRTQIIKRLFSISSDSKKPIWADGT